MNGKPDSRLLAAAAFVRPDAVLADVGTDHALLPVYLAQAGRISGGVASDLRASPVARARQAIASAGLSDRIAVVQTDGLAGIDRYRPTDIVIAGMGGELICEILAAAPWVCSASIRLILQPMTKDEVLREFLASHGFAVAEETLVQEGEKLYCVLCASHDGQIRSFSEAELWAGVYHLSHPSPLSRAWIRRKADRVQTRIEGLRRAGRDTSREETLHQTLEGWAL